MDTQRFDHCPWLFAADASDDEQAAQAERQRSVGGDTTFGERCYVAHSAAVFPERLRLGADSYIAAHAYVTGDVRTGSDCTINPFTVVRGTVRLGDGVRIGAHTSLLGFNHTAAPDRPVFQQPVTSVGITVGDDVWIGSHVVVVDGVTIGDHCVVGAGAVVTKDLPPWTVAAGNPARPLRDRRATTGGDALSRFTDIARDQAADVLARCWNGDAYVDRPGAAPAVRAHCDAVEIADLLLGEAPAQLPAPEHVRRLASWQDPVTGLVPEPGRPLPAGFPDEGPELYHVLCVGYALHLLGSSFPHPVAQGDGLAARLGALPWQDRAWEAGAWVDAWATAAHWNGSRPDELFGWLLLNADPWTGTWGTPSPHSGRLQVVNGYYRLTRGSFAQFGVPVPHPARVVDVVLDHARDTRYFGAGQENACNVLDVAHPLWLCRGQIGDYRAAEIRVWARTQLDAALSRWVDGQGFSFGPGTEPGLQGTEMWLAIIWYLAALTGRAESLGYEPRGVHRPWPASGRNARPSSPTTNAAIALSPPGRSS